MRKRVLVVDDDTENRESICRMVVRKSMYAESATTFKEGVDKVRDASDIGSPFDLVILDLGLPDVKDGYDSLNRLGEFGEVPIVFFTGMEDPALIQEFQRKRRPFILKGSSGPSMLKTILTELEWQHPSEDTARELLDAHQEEKKLVASATEPQSWLRRNAAPISAVSALCAIVLCVLTVIGSATGGVNRVVNGAKEDALTNEAITRGLNDRKKEIDDERLARQSLESRVEGQNAEIIKKLEALREDAVVLHKENEASKAERNDLKASVGQINGTTRDIYDVLLRRR